MAAKLWLMLKSDRARSRLSRSGRNGVLSELKSLVEGQGGEVAGVAVVIYQPYPNAIKFDPLPFYYLARLDPKYFLDASTCELCKKGIPPVHVRV